MTSRRVEELANAPRSWIAAAVTLVIVATVFWSVACMNDRERGPTIAAADNRSPPIGLPSSVERYIEFAATAGDPQSGLSDAQVAEGLRQLAGALGTLNMAGPDLLIDLRVGAEHFLLNPGSIETAATVRESLVEVADALEPGSELEPAVRGAAESIRPDRPLIEQRGDLLHFFRLTADAIRRRSPDS